MLARPRNSNSYFIGNKMNAFGNAVAVKSVRTKFLDEICGSSKDTRFFMGTVFPYNTWVVIGTFWPPKQYQPSLL
jgi:hypothetical protein